MNMKNVKNMLFLAVIALIIFIPNGKANSLTYDEVDQAMKDGLQGAWDWLTTDFVEGTFPDGDIPITILENSDKSVQVEVTARWYDNDDPSSIKYIARFVEGSSGVLDGVVSTTLDGRFVLDPNVWGLSYDSNTDTYNYPSEIYTWSVTGTQDLLGGNGNKISIVTNYISPNNQSPQGGEYNGFTLTDVNDDNPDVGESTNPNTISQQCADAKSAIEDLRVEMINNFVPHYSNLRTYVTTLRENASQDVVLNAYNEFNSSWSIYESLVNKLRMIQETYHVSTNCPEALDALNSLKDQLNTYGENLKGYNNTIEQWIAELARTVEDEEYRESLERELELMQDDIARERERALQALQGLNDSFSDGFSGTGAMDCNGIIGHEVMSDIREILKWIRIAAPILIVILGSLDFGKAVISDDANALSKATSTFVKRLIAAVILFFVPLLIDYLLDKANMVADHITNGCNL